ncbi:MAG TPA: DUF1549 domain-containing protein [Verrucomicrobiales bacterium]|nr:DUF1549 domain-containing protein [Verrucomicrobiales bacterium]
MRYQLRSSSIKQLAQDVSFMVCVALFVLTAPAKESPIDFNKEIRPILAENCLVCHGPDDSKGGLRLTNREIALGKLKSGQTAVIPGNPDASALIQRIFSEDPDEQMPPPDKGEALNISEKQLLRRWIEEGADWPLHWAFRPLQLPISPLDGNNDWGRNKIDQFVAARLGKEGVVPSPEAGRVTLIRRLHYDLLGIPPKPHEVDAFVEDSDPVAYERLVDRLLASPHFGERWGRHWLDKARYADSDGYEKDRDRPNAWKYRDWVIDAINEDLPFDEFTIRQLAGDLIADGGKGGLLATAFNRQTLTNTEGGTDQEQWRVAAVMDRTETLGSVWLGLTVGCARCHNHKYDLISQKEYYQMYAYFDNGDETDINIIRSEMAVKKHAAEKKIHDKKIRKLQREISQMEAELKQDLIEWEKAMRSQLPFENGEEEEALPSEISKALLKTREDRTDQQQQKIADYFYRKKIPEMAQLLSRKDDLQKHAPASPKMKVRAISQRTDDPRVTHILRRGEFKQPLDEVSPGTLAALPRFSGVTGHGEKDRLELARWLVNGRNPLVPRVAVNHIWAHLFGEGLVRTPNDFGVRGDRPTHPGLLDWLASSYIDLGWSRKALIRKIVRSATYRQSSAHRLEMTDLDPANQLLHRQNRFRVEAEIIRDLSLSVSGLLSTKVGGPSVYPPMPPEVAALNYNSAFKWVTSLHGDQYRRGLYTFFKRTAPHPNLTNFDCPDSNVTCVKRTRSNTPISALTTLNNPVFTEAARALAFRLLKYPDLSNDTNRLEYGFRLCVARQVGSDELEPLLSFLEKGRRWYRVNPDEADKVALGETILGLPNYETAAWILTVRILLNLDEFITRD